MALTQSETICFLAVEMGNADGEMIDPEKKIYLNNPVFRKHIKKFDLDLYNLKLKRGEFTKKAAIRTLKARSKNTQLDALAILWHVLIADGAMEEGEEKLMLKLLVEFDIEVNDVKSRLEKLRS